VSDWYENFFYGLALELWRKVPTPEVTRAEADFLEQELGLDHRARVLDVPYGNGRHALELARRGHSVAGVDISPEFHQEACAAAAAAGLDAQFLLGEMRQLPWKSEFDGAYCFGNCFGYLDRAGSCEFLRAVARTLKPSRRFVIDTGLVAESLLPALELRRSYQVDDVRMEVEGRYDVLESRLDDVYTFERDGQRQTNESSYFISTIAEIRRMLDESGFGIAALYTSTAREPYQLGSRRLLLVAEKR
jgi:SAM-dependent methyltransferase